MDEYKITFFYSTDNKSVPVREYIDGISWKERAKILKYIEFLREREGVLDEPYTKHIQDKIRELRVDFGKQRHRIFFFTYIGKNIILLHAFLKRTTKTPASETRKALHNYEKILRNPKIYE